MGKCLGKILKDRKHKSNAELRRLPQSTTPLNAV